jgi:hypothetical protein
MFTKPPSVLVWFLFGLIVVLAFFIGYLPALSAPVPGFKAVIHRAAGQSDMLGCAVAAVFRHRVRVYPKQLGSFCGGYIHGADPVAELLRRHRDFYGHASLPLCDVIEPNIPRRMISCK